MNAPMTAPRRALALCLLALAAYASPAAWAQDFDVRTASLWQAEGQWLLSARVDYRLTDKALAALENGIALTFRVEVSVSRLRRWWTNPEVLNVERDWRLSYEPLTRRYLVQYPDGREQTAHATLFGALNAIGRVQSLPIAEASRLDPHETYIVAVRAVLDQHTLPAPLQFFAFWGSGFSLESEWYEWRIKT